MREMELVTLAAAADGRKGPRPAKPGDGPKHAAVHTECLNCGATLHGRYCAACGQGIDDHHRSILHLLWEVIEDFTHLDGRLMQTLPPLFLKPGQLARDHFEGRRMRHVPPLRLFLITLLIFMFCLEVRTSPKAQHPGAIPGVKISSTTTTTSDKADKPDADDDADDTTPARAVRDAIRQSLKPTAAAPPPPATPAPAPSAVQVTRSPTGGTVKVGGGFLTVSSDKASHDITAAEANQGFSQMRNSKFGKTPFGAWLAEHGSKAMANQAYFKSTMFEWGHRLSILLLPIFAGMLALVYFYKRQFYIYDHLIVSMHFLSFTFLIWAVAYLVPDPAGAVLFLVATIWTPVNLFMTLRGAYGSSILGAVLKTFFLWTVALSLFLVLLLGVIFIAMGSM